VSPWVQVTQITDLIACTRRQLEGHQRMKIMNMITIDAHSRDMVIQISDQKETSARCFKWMSQLRTYWAGAYTRPRFSST
jgi:dynein heavy chain